MVFTIIEFVTQNLGPQFVESPPIKLSTLYEDTSSTVPLIFVLSSGSDPMSSFLRFAKEKSYMERYVHNLALYYVTTRIIMGCRVHAISLGQGQGPVAEKLITNATANGDWVFLQVCRLSYL